MSMQELESLRRENRRLKAQIERMQQAGSPHIGLRLGLTATESIFFALLMKHDFVSHQLAYDTLYNDREEPVQDGALHAHVVNLRRKLGFHKIEIHTVYGEGWWVDANDRHRVLSRWGDVGDIVDAGRTIRGG
jgi:DNA-binding response OmpR family regulator